MLDLKKKVDIIKEDELRVGDCPSCAAIISQCYYMVDKSTNKKSRWFSCRCGVVFNAQKPTKVYDEKYWLEHNKYDAKQKDSYEYPIRIYAPIAEELVYGRRVLIVGRPNTYQEEAFRERGWVTTVIDKNTCMNESDNLIASDFETYQFPENIKYNMIWFYDVIECFSNPIGALELCKNIMPEDGLVFVSTPDTDLINTRSNSCFIHWKADEHYVMWNKRSLSKHMDSIGFNTIMCRTNLEHRFNSWDNIHGLYQRCFF